MSRKLLSWHSEQHNEDPCYVGVPRNEVGFVANVVLRCTLGLMWEERLRVVTPNLWVPGPLPHQEIGLIYVMHVVCI